MKGSLQKRIMASHLACHVCAYFRDDDPDLYYCALHCDEFPGLCGSFESKCAAKEAGCIPKELIASFSV
jgi:hypothetical protein